MAETVYEGLFIFDANMYSSDAHKVSGALTKTIEKHGGQIMASRLWEERRLAYPINNKRTGVYWLTYFKLDSLKLTAVEGDFRLNDTILRSLILKVDARIAEALVEHALVGAPPRTETRRVPAIEIDDEELEEDEE